MATKFTGTHTSHQSLLWESLWPISNHEWLWCYDSRLPFYIERCLICLYELEDIGCTTAYEFIYSKLFIPALHIILLQKIQFTSFSVVSDRAPTTSVRFAFLVTISSLIYLLTWIQCKVGRYTNEKQTEYLALRNLDYNGGDRHIKPITSNASVFLDGMAAFTNCSWTYFNSGMGSPKFRAGI